MSESEGSGSVFQYAICDVEGCSQRGALRCTGCQCAYYCSVSCQKVDWKEHKIACKRMKRFAAERAESDAQRARFLERYEIANKESINSECSICYEVITSNPIQLKCSHSFCMECVKAYVDSSTNRRDLSCPLCRSNEGQYIAQSIYNTAFQFKTRAEEFKDDDPLRLHYCELAKAELTKVLDDTGSGLGSAIQGSVVIHHTKADILYLEGAYEASAELMTKVVAQYESVSTRVEVHWLEALFKLSNAYRKLHRYEDALQETRKAMNRLQDPNEHMKWIRNFFHEALICFYELGQYENAISIGEGAVAMNRHYEGVHAPIALSYHAMGNIDGCIDMFRQAVLYETPWDLENVAAQREQLLYYEAKKREQQQQQQQQQQQLEQDDDDVP